MVDKKPVGLGGWLFVIFILNFILIITLARGIVIAISTNSINVYGFILGMGLFLLGIFNMILMFKKSKRTPLFQIIFIWLLFTLYLIGQTHTNSVPSLQQLQTINASNPEDTQAILSQDQQIIQKNQQNLANQSGSFLIVLVLSIILNIYWVKSKRVKNTFIR